MNLFMVRHKLFTMKQDGRTIDEFVTELQNQGRPCKFEEHTIDLVLHALVMGIDEESTGQRLFDKQDLILEKAIDLCRHVADVCLDMKQLEEVHAVGNRKYNNPKGSKRVQHVRSVEDTMRRESAQHLIKGAWTFCSSMQKGTTGALGRRGKQ